MPKDTFYFQHDYNARNDEKILELRAEFGPLGYGVFWMIIETMAENENAGINRKFITGLSISYGLAKAELSKIIDHCLSTDLFYEDNGSIFSKRLLRHIDFRIERSETGKNGAKKRWGINGSAIANDSIGKERKGKEIIKGNYFSEDGLSCCLSDGTLQKLTLDQLRSLREGVLKPHFVKKGDKD